MSAFRKRRLLALMIALFGLMSLAATAVTSQGPTARLVFEHVPDGSPPWPTIDIWSMNADGTHPKELTADGHSHDPSWSLDGRHIVFIHDTFWPGHPPMRLSKQYESRFAFELYVMDSDGKNPHLLRRLGSSTSSVAWSPDGKTLAVTYTPLDNTILRSERGEPAFGLFLMPSDGAGEPRLLFRAAIDPAWSPDGKKLAFSVRVPGTGYAIAVGDADGSHEVQLTDPSAYTISPYLRYAFSPAWSPDGKQIAFNARVAFFTSWDSMAQSEQRQIFLMRADGSGRRQLTTDPKWECSHPSWSPDGAEIAFSCVSPSAAVCWGASAGRAPEVWVPPRFGCVRRIFVLRVDNPKAKPIQITQHDGVNPSFAPVP